jgi:ankyrin repeat protein
MDAWKICWLAALLLCGCANRDMALYEAVELGEVGNVERLLAAGADPQAIPDTRFLLPLEVAAKVGIAQVAKSLIKYGAQPDSATSKETPLWIALHYSNGLTAAEIVKGGANYMSPEFEGCTPFHYALLNDERAVVAAMLLRGADPNAEGCFGRALQVAASKQSVDVLMDLLKAGADPNLPDSLGETAIFSAVEYANLDVLRLLIDHGAEIDAQDRDGNSALHQSAIANKMGSTQRALELGADPNLRNLAGETPLHLAALHAQPGVVVQLLEAGADPRLKTSYGATPLRIAQERNHGTIIIELSAAEAALTSRPRNP